MRFGTVWFAKLPVRTYVIEAQTLFVPYLSRMLERAGLSVIETSAVLNEKSLSEARPGVVFVDIDYSERGGMTLLCGIRETLERSPDATGAPHVVAYSSGGADETRRASCYISGATLVYSKDASEDELVAALRSSVGTTVNEADAGASPPRERLAKRRRGA